MASPPDEEIAAVRVALDLAAIPSRRRQLRNAPLPKGVALLLRIAIDELDAMEAIAKRMQMSPHKLRKAAAFYIEQILLAPNADSYRVLGARRSATTPELRRNLALLCKWLHSEAGQNMAQSMFFLRITHAWNNVKTPERRAAYDAMRARAAALSASRDSQNGDLAEDQRANKKLKHPGGEMSGERSGQGPIVSAGQRRKGSL
jgi:hypothetical protein